MSDIDEKNSEDLSFDLGLGSFTDDEATRLSTLVSDGQSDTGFSDSDETFGEVTPSALDGLPDVGPDVPAEPFEGAVPLAEPEFPAMPSSFLTENTDVVSEEQEAIGLVVGISEKEKTGKRKREKKQKTSKEAGPREPMDLGSMVCLGFGFALFLGLIVINALMFTSQEKNSIGGSSKLYYAAIVNVFGLIIVAVPFLLWKFRKGNEPKERLQLFDVLLGASLVALTIGVLCFLAVFFRYDFTMK